MMRKDKKLSSIQEFDLKFTKSKDRFVNVLRLTLDWIEN